MDTKLTEFRCPYCPPIVKGALLFKAAGNAIVQTNCPRCGKKYVTIEVNTVRMDYEEAKKMVMAND
jgi:predicted RNA-binding Zn-ribbon protein involved in translation (DUF1610 family)